MRKFLYVFLILVLTLTIAAPALADKPTGFDAQGNVTSQAAENGFDASGYNRTARIFSGTCLQWGTAKVDDAWARNWCGDYINDKIIMKWNAEWDRGNDSSWSDPNGYAAWENNEWNGKVPGGSGEVWHYKIVWVNTVCSEGDPVNGGSCVWGHFEILMSQGTTADNEHLWLDHATPNGYGAPRLP
jgi:hypothetical protein